MPCRNTNLPNERSTTLDTTPMNADPIAVKMLLAMTAPFLPRPSMKMFATRLPTKPPIVKTEVMIENAKSDMGIHVGKEYWGKPEVTSGSNVILQVRTAWI